MNGEKIVETLLELLDVRDRLENPENDNAYIQLKVRERELERLLVTLFNNQ
jgi:hypothetical protein